MNVQYLVDLIKYKGWKNIAQNANYMGYYFDIVGERKFFITKWNLLLKIVGTLDEWNVEEFRKIFTEISEKSKSWILGRCFLFCIIADNISPSITGRIERDSFGLFGMFRLKGGGGNVFLADLKNKRIFGEVPTIPLDIHMYSKDLKEILEQMIGQGATS